MIKILAGNYTQAHVYAIEHGLAPSEWAYVGDPQKMMGLRGAQFVVVGTFKQRRDAQALEDQARSYGWVEQKP